MNVNELRIGNWVVHEPTIDDWEEIQVKCGNIIQCEISPDSFEPIQLTEEWLTKFGFEKLMGYYTSKESNIEFFLSNGNLYCELYGETIFNIKYVHQLQNLHFILLGEELTIK